MDNSAQCSGGTTQSEENLEWKELKVFSNIIKIYLCPLQISDLSQMIRILKVKKVIRKFFEELINIIKNFSSRQKAASATSCSIQSKLSPS